MIAVDFKIGCLSEQQFLGLMLPPAAQSLQDASDNNLEFSTLRLLSALETTYGKSQRNPLLLKYLKLHLKPSLDESLKQKVQKIVDAFASRLIIPSQKNSLAEVQEIVEGRKTVGRKNVDAEIMDFIQLIDRIIQLKPDQKHIDVLSHLEGKGFVEKLITLFKNTYEKIELFLQDFLLNGCQDEQQGLLLEQLRESLHRFQPFLEKLEEQTLDMSDGRLVSGLREMIIQEFLAVLKLEMPSILHEDDFIMVSEEQMQPVLLFNDSLLVNLAISFQAACNTLTKMLKSYGPDPMTEFCKHNPFISPEFYYPIQHLLSSGSRLKSNDIKVMLEFLQIIYPDMSDLILECLTMPSVGIEGRYPFEKVARRLRDYLEERPLYFKRRYLVIPFTYPSHIVMLMVDFKEKRTIYYDSQGCPSSANCRKVYNNFDMRLELERIHNICFAGDPEANIYDCYAIHQQEMHNCGVYVVNFVELILMCRSFDDIQRKTFSFEEIEQIRELYAWRMAKVKIDPEES